MKKIVGEYILKKIYIILYKATYITIKTQCVHVLVINEKYLFRKKSVYLYEKCM